MEFRCFIHKSLKLTFREIVKTSWHIALLLKCTYSVVNRIECGLLGNINIVKIILVSHDVVSNVENYRRGGDLTQYKFLYMVKGRHTSVKHIGNKYLSNNY